MTDQKYSVKVLEKVMKILNLYTYSDTSFTLDKITRRTGLSKTTVFRILKTLEKYGAFKYNAAEETYNLGIRFLELGGIVYGSLSIRKVASPYLDTLSHSLKATILFGIMESEQLLYIDKRESESLIRVSSYMGLKRSPYFGVLGMTLVAYMDDRERRRLLKLYPPAKITAKTVTKTRDVLRKLDQIREAGYYVERGEIIDGVMGVGVPIMDFSGKVVAALGACMPEFQVKAEDLERGIQSLVSASKAISKDLGYV